MCLPEIYDLLNRVFLAAEALHPGCYGNDDYVLSEAELYEVPDEVV